jgi:hypothetical protein
MMLLQDLKLAAISVLRKSGWGMLGIVAVILVAHWLRTKHLDTSDAIDSVIACCVYWTLASIVEYSRLKSQRAG